ncbi:VWA domain-containing protein, partial [Paraglaciecola sp.]|nr:VWA domain-containing protein [Paraglaciecola sp.]
MSLIYEHVFLCQRISQMRAYLGIKMLSTMLSRALKKRTRAVFNSTKPLLPVFLSVLVMTPVWADDTEIFFGGGSNSDATPNVLFVIDTSGSMGNNVSGTNDSRITVVKDALTELVSTVN